MTQWTVITPSGQASVIMTADTMMQIDGQLRFYKNGEIGPYAIFADGGWLSVSHMPEAA